MAVTTLSYWGLQITLGPYPNFSPEFLYVTLINVTLCPWMPVYSSGRKLSMPKTSLSSPQTLPLPPFYLVSPFYLMPPFYLMQVSLPLLGLQSSKLQKLCSDFPFPPHLHLSGSYQILLFSTTEMPFESIIIFISLSLTLYFGFHISFPTIQLSPMSTVFSILYQRYFNKKHI